MVSSGGRGTAGSGPSGRVTPAGRHGRSRGRWDLADGDAESVLAEARKAFFVMAGFLAVIWILQIANWADHYRITLDYGIRPRDIASLPDLVSAPFLHFSWAHIEGNSGPLFIFGFLAAYRGVRKFIWVTILIILTSGLAAWLAEPPNTVGGGSVLAVAFAARLAPLMVINDPGWKLVEPSSELTIPPAAICGCVAEPAGASGITLRPETVSA